MEAKAVRPVRRKYVEERHKPWFIFGESINHVDIADSDGDVLCRVPRAIADKIIEEHNKLVDVIGDMALAWDDEHTFDSYWYGT